MTSYTESLRVVLNDTATRDGLWGGDANTVFELFEDAIAGYLQVNMATATILDASNNAVDQARYAMLEFTGTPSATVSAQVPAVSKVYLAKCSIGSSDTVVLHPVGGNGVNFVNGDQKLVFCDGTDMHELIGTKVSSNVLVDTNNLSDIANVTAAVSNLGFTATLGELNLLDGATVTVGELNILDGATVTVGELNILDGATVTVGELNILDGVTVSTGELNYLAGVTSNIQTQLDGKAGTALVPKATGFLYWNGTASSIVEQNNMQFVSIANVGGNLNVHVSFSGILGNTTRAHIIPHITMIRTDLYTEVGLSYTSIKSDVLRFRGTGGVATKEQIINVAIFGVSG